MCKWNEMNILSNEEIKKRLRNCENVIGCFLLYEDGTKISIGEGYDRQTIIDHINNGGLVGEELQYAIFPDKTRVLVPPIVDISEMGFFDEMETKMWEIIKEYFKLMNIKLENPNDIDFSLIKTMQDTLLKNLEESGVNFKRDPELVVPLRIGQKRRFNESGNEFVVGKLVYDDRDFYECIYTDGTVSNHAKWLIECRSVVID